MNPEPALRHSYQEWLRLAEIEGQAIRSRNWALVADCQAALRRLQPEILLHTEAARRHWSRLGAERSARQDVFQGMVALLLELEQRNQQLLDQSRQAASLQWTQLEQTRANLRRIQRSYAPTPQAAWVSFS
jgi:hypothetical protein